MQQYICHSKRKRRREKAWSLVMGPRNGGLERWVGANRRCDNMTDPQHAAPRHLPVLPGPACLYFGSCLLPVTIAPLSRQ